MSCPDNSLFVQPPVTSSSDSHWYESEMTTDSAMYDDFSDLGDEICGVHWWGATMDYDSHIGDYVPCDEGDPFRIEFRADDGGQPGPVVCTYEVTATRVSTGVVVDGWPVWHFSAELPSCCSLASGWVGIRGLGDIDCHFMWLNSPVGNSYACKWITGEWEPRPITADLSLCLTAADSDGDGVPDSGDACPGFDDTVDADADNVPDGCDECPDTPSCATNIDSDGCAIDSDGDGSPDGCPPAAQEGCCGPTGPVAPLGLAAGMLLLSRHRSRRVEPGG